MANAQALLSIKGESVGHFSEKAAKYLARLSLRYDQPQLKQFCESTSAAGVDMASELIDAIKSLDLDDQLKIEHYKPNINGYLVLAQLRLGE